MATLPQDERTAAKFGGDQRGGWDRVSVGIVRGRPASKNKWKIKTLRFHSLAVVHPPNGLVPRLCAPYESRSRRHESRRRDAGVALLNAALGPFGQDSSSFASSARWCQDPPAHQSGEVFVLRLPANSTFSGLGMVSGFLF